MLDCLFYLYFCLHPMPQRQNLGNPTKVMHGYEVYRLRRPVYRVGL